jgi:hypothetical protein
VLLAIPLDGKPCGRPDPERLYGVIWILAKTPTTAIIATTRWVGTERQLETALADRRSREVATRWRLRKHTLAWRIGSPPGSALIGVEAPPEGEPEARSNAGAWDDIRAAFLEHAGMRKPHAATSGARPTFARLRRTTWFASWRGHVPAPTIRAARAILGEAVDALDALAPPAVPRRALILLKQAMRAMNALERREPFITTVEAEEVVEALATIAAAAGIDEETFQSKVDVLREF